ncbi:hypothetical protein [Bradyrhizobium elkanii]|uniref:hypothetical protein n=1 Tax=Bradyrhizobium elkanii TaxID=29448 RepID=UPI001AE33F54|nr:hypothetical protein [Bradyrhizobium elkanii]MBP2428850.1 hypothetical protein [Bradyrhizobium elkanii]WLA93601.1 hypothetical protein QNJ96_10135 [Bradyrhizobium elkanii]
MAVETRLLICVRAIATSLKKPVTHRGAYTVRFLADVISYRGVPRQLPGGEPLPLDVAGLARAR